MCISYFSICVLETACLVSLKQYRWWCGGAKLGTHAAAVPARHRSGETYLTARPTSVRVMTPSRQLGTSTVGRERVWESAIRSPCSTRRGRGQGPVPRGRCGHQAGLAPTRVRATLSRPNSQTGHQTACGWGGALESLTQVGCQDVRVSPEAHRAASVTPHLPRRVGAGRFAPGPLRAEAHFGGGAVSAGTGCREGLGRRGVTRDPPPPTWGRPRDTWDAGASAPRTSSPAVGRPRLGDAPERSCLRWGRGLGRVSHLSK